MGYSGGVVRLWFHSGGSGKNLFPCLFQVLDTTYILWLMASSSTFKARNIRLNLYHITSH